MASARRRRRGTAPLSPRPAASPGSSWRARPGTIGLLAELHPRVADFDADGEREKARKDAGVQARLYESYPIRFWDHYLGPREPRLFVADPPASDDAPLGEIVDLTGPERGGPARARVRHPARRRRARDRPGGGTPSADAGDDILVIDRATGERRSLAGDEGFCGSPAFSPDGRSLAYLRGTLASPDAPVHIDLAVVDLETGEQRLLATALDRWPIAPQFTPDGRAIVFTADDQGCASIFRVEVRRRPVDPAGHGRGVQRLA